MRGLYIANAALFTATVLGDFIFLGWVNKFRQWIGELMEEMNAIKRREREGEHKQLLSIENETKINEMIEAMTREIQRFTETKNEISEKNKEALAVLDSKVKDIQSAIDETRKVAIQGIDEKLEAGLENFNRKETSIFKLMDQKADDNLCILSDRMAGALSSLKLTIHKIEEKINGL